MTTNTFRLSLMCLSILLVWSTTVTAEDYVEWVGANSGVNWSAGQATAEGAGVAPAKAKPSIARLMACRAAVVDAQRNLLESMQGVRVSGTTVVKDMMLESDVIATTVTGVLQGATIVKRTPNDDGTCLITMSAPLGGDMTRAIYAETMATASHVPSQGIIDWMLSLADTTLGYLVAPAYASDTAPSSAPWQDAFDQLATRIGTLEDLLTTHPAVVTVADQKPTGLVLDARGSNFIPSMTPKIRKIRAGVMYPSARHQTNARDRGQLVSLFTRDLDTARRHPIVGDRPVVLKALRTFGETRTEIVLGSESSERLENLIKDGFLSDAGVIIVL